MCAMKNDPYSLSPNSERLLPPIPRGGLRELVRDPLGYFSSIVNQYGDIVCYRPAPDTAYLINHPDMIRHVLVDNQRNYSKDTYSNQAFKKAIGEGLINLEGNAWRHQRRLMQPAFHHQRLEELDGMIVQATTEMLGHWQTLSQEGEPVDVAREMAALTMTITSRALFGVDLGDEVKTIGEIVNGVADLIEKPNHPRLQQAIKEFSAVVDRIVAQRRNDFQGGNDLLSSLLVAHDTESGEMLDDQHIRNEVMGLLLAGYETTANALTWTLYLLSQHTWAMQGLREEVHQTLDGRLPTAADLAGLPYLRKVLNESLRMFPPAWIIGRRALAADNISGYFVPAGTVIAICIYTLHRHATYWEEPERFDPERFTPERSAGREHYAYIPFSTGPRQCIGSGFALLEASLILACVAQRFELRLVQGVEIKPQALFVLRPNRGLLMSLQA